MCCAMLDVGPCRRRAGADEDDIDAILAQLDVEGKTSKSVNIRADCPPPCPRVCGVWVPTGDLVRSSKLTKPRCAHLLD